MTLESDYCVCAMAEEDPLHYGWHRIYEWNLDIFGRETIKRHKVFDTVYGHEFKPKQPEQPYFDEVPF
jgi:hypothetical protein